MSRKKDGLIKPDKNLNTVRSAGFGRHKKKSLKISENTRAGLDAKERAAEGVARVKRRRPLALKHKRRMIQAGVALSAAGIAAVSVFAYGFFAPANVGVADGEFYTEYLELPADGTTPAEHTGAENIGYMNYVLQNRPYWYSEMSSTISINAVGINIVQQVNTVKQSYEGVTISTDITTSSMVNSARQYCAVKNPAVVLWVDSADKNPATYNGLNTPWSTGEASGMSRADFRRSRGCVQDEFAVYVINKDTIISCDDVVDNGDGTYSQSFVLNHADSPAENSAVYYYRYQMQNSGGLSALPAFSSVNVTYTFNSKWEVLSSEINENYVATMGPINAGATSSSKTVYTYDEALARSDRYEQYFKQYENNFGTPAEESITPSGCLSAAFGSILTGEAKLSLDLQTGANDPVHGELQLDITKGDIRAEIGNIKVYLKEDEKKYLFISYGDGLKAKIALDDLTAAIGELPQNGQSGEGSKDGETSQNAENAQEGEGGFDTNSLLSQLADGEFTIDEAKTKATLSSVLDLSGLGIPLTVPLVFDFNIADGGKTITLGGVSTKLTLLGMDLSASLAFSEKGVEALTPEEEEKYCDLALEKSIIPMLSANALSAEISFEKDDIAVEGNLVVNLGELAVRANLDLVLGGDTSAAKSLAVIYSGGKIYAEIASKGQTPVKVCADVEEATKLIGDLLGVDIAEKLKGELSQKLKDIIAKIDLGDLVNTLLADEKFASNFSLSKEGVIAIDGTSLLGKFGVNFELGEVLLGIKDGEVTLSALGADICLKQCEPFEFDSQSYVSSDIVALARKIAAVVDEGGLSVKGEMTLSALGMDILLNVKELSVRFSDGLSLSLIADLTIDGATKPLYVSYKDGEVTAAFDRAGVRLAQADFPALLNAVSGLVAEVTGKPFELDISLDKLKKDFTADDIYKLINSLGISASGDDLITLQTGGLTLGISEGEGEEILSLDLTYTGKDFSLSLANASAYPFAGIAACPEEVTVFDGAKLIPLIEGVRQIIADGGITASGSVSVTLKNVPITLNIKELSLNLKEGLNLFMNAELGVNGVVHGVYAQIGGERSALVYDGVGVALDKTAEDGSDNYSAFLSSVLNMYNAIAREADLPELNSLDIKEIARAAGLDLDKIKDSVKGDIKIGEILSGLQLFGRDGKFAVDYNGIALALAAGDGNLVTAEVNCTVKGVKIAGTLAVDPYAPKGELPADAYYCRGEEITTILNGVAEAIENGGLTVKGTLVLGLDTARLALGIENLSISWKNGLSFALDARLALGESQHDIYASFDGTNLKFIYGGMGAEIALTGDDGKGGKAPSDDLALLESAATELYNRIAGVVNNIVDGGDVLKRAESLSDIMSLINGGKESVLDIESIVEAVAGAPVSDIPALINAVRLVRPIEQNGLLRIELGGLAVELCRGTNAFAGMNADLEVKLETAEVVLNLSNVEISQYNAPKVPELSEGGELLSAADLAEALDYVAASLEMLSKSEFDIDLSATVSSDDPAYEKTGGIKYDIDATFEYVQGASGFPLHFFTGTAKDAEGNDIPFDKRDDINFWVAPDMYAHITVDMNSTIAEVNSVLFDFYVFDADPSFGEDGKTTGEYSPTAEGEPSLDVFMSISGVPLKGETDASGNVISHEPVKIYAPVSEIMTVISAGVAMLDLGSLESQNATIASVLSALTHVADDLLIDQWIPDVRDEFASLGSSLIDQFIDGGLQSIIDALGKALDKADEQVSTPSVSQREEGERLGIIDKLSVSYEEDGRSRLTVGAGDVQFTMDKEAYEGGSRITGVAIGDVELPAKGDSTAKERLGNLSMSIAYEGVEKPISQSGATLSGYYNLTGIDTLLKALVHSATHKEVISGEEGAESSSYALNNVFYINGKINLNGVLHFVFNYNIADLTVTLNAISVTVDKDTNDIALNLRISYPKFKAVVDIINADGVADITLKKGMIYLKRVSGGETIYRAMTVEEFGKDALNQIGFLFNLGSVITDEFAKTDSGATEKKAAIKQDYGTQLATYLKQFAYNAEQGKWKIVLNGAGILQNDIISLSDIVVEFGAEKSEENGRQVYYITGLDVNTSLRVTLVGNLYIDLTIDGTLYYANPCNEWRNTAADGNVAATAADVFGNSPAVYFGRWLNGETFEEICARNDWAAMTAANGGKYVEVSFSGNSSEASAAKGDITFGTVSFYRQKGVESGEREFISTQYALYDRKQNKLLSSVLFPDISAYDNIDHYVLEWGEYSADNFTGALEITAQYVPQQYEVKIFSDCKINENYVESPAGGYVRAFTLSYKKSLDLKLDVVVEGKRIRAFLTENGEELTREQVAALRISSDISLTVVWEDIPYTVSYVISGDGPDKVIKQLTAYYGDEISLDSEELGISAEEVAEVGYDFAGWKISGGAEFVNGNMTVTAQYTPYSRVLHFVSDHPVNEFWHADGDKYYREIVYTNAQFGSPANHLVLSEGATWNDTHILNGYRDEEGNVIHYIDFITQKTDATYTAVWEQFAHRVVFTYNTGDGDKTISKGFTEGGVLDLESVPVPAKTGHTGEWRFEGSNEAIAERYITVNSDLRIVAYYTPKEYTVTLSSDRAVAGFEKSGSRWTVSKVFRYGETADLSSLSYDIENYDFGGFYTADESSAGGTRVERLTVTDDITVYIYWIDNEIDINLYSTFGFTAAQAGTVTQSEYGSKVYMSNVVLHDGYSIAAPVKSNDGNLYEFKGWWYFTGESWVQLDLSDVSKTLAYNPDEPSYSVHALWYYCEQAEITAVRPNKDFTFTANVKYNFSGAASMLNGSGWAFSEVSMYGKIKDSVGTGYGDVSSSATPVTSFDGATNTLTVTATNSMTRKPNLSIKYNYYQWSLSFTASYNGTELANVSRGENKQKL